MISGVAAAFVKEHIDNLRSNLSKCALMLAKEVFEVGASASGQDTRLGKFTAAVLPHALIKTVFEKHFIAIEAKKACEQCAKGGANALSESVDAMLEGSRQIKNLALAEQASASLVLLIKAMPNEYFSTPSDSMRSLIS